MEYLGACFDSGMMTPVQELDHTLGFVHEHTRPGRDDFFSINYANIKPGEEKNFEKRPHGTSDYFEKGLVDSKNTPYDVLSLLHYGPQVRSILLKVLDKNPELCLPGLLQEWGRCPYLPPWPP